MRAFAARFLAGLALALVLSLAAAVTGGYVWARRSLPELSGVRELRALASEIEIVRDAPAIPHIYAKSVEDAHFGLGYVHAQDRLWQLELNRRVAKGRLAELVGARALQSDEPFRTLGLARVAEQTFRALDRDTRGVLEAYARGVNAWLDEQHPLPPEFALLGCTPERWQPADSVLFIKLLAWQLSGNWSDELWRVRLGQQLSAAELAEFLPPYPGGPRSRSPSYGRPIRASSSARPIESIRCCVRSRRSRAGSRRSRSPTSARRSARTTGRSTARAPRAASRCSRTTRTSR